MKLLKSLLRYMIVAVFKRKLIYVNVFVSSFIKRYLFACVRVERKYSLQFSFSRLVVDRSGFKRVRETSKVEMNLNQAW